MISELKAKTTEMIGFYGLIYILLCNKCSDLKCTYLLLHSFFLAEKFRHRDRGFFHQSNSIFISCCHWRLVFLPIFIHCWQNSHSCGCRTKVPVSMLIAIQADWSASSGYSPLFSISSVQVLKKIWESAFLQTSWNASSRFPLLQVSSEDSLL